MNRPYTPPQAADRNHRPGDSLDCARDAGRDPLRGWRVTPVTLPNIAGLRVPGPEAGRAQFRRDGTSTAAGPYSVRQGTYQ